MRAVIFDLDGTLIDAALDITSKLNQVLAADGHAPLTLNEVRSMIGDGAKVLVERAFAARGTQAQAQNFERFMTIYAENPVIETVIYEGIIPALETLRDEGRPLGICTNKPMRATQEVLAALDLARFFGAVVGGDSTPYRKPDPRHLAAALAGLEVTDAIMVGDHANDMNAAAGLGLPAIFCTWGYGEGKGEARAEHPAELPGLITRLG
ncbi:HAD-IA family hydrolase [Acidocella aminolytica]|jgi:phosphoglycolate phosphatase|uniref:phosphoglycolate phosphatase n=1 Tax=Acidocella aminolytica 101 = DSM 11237 TaxID=1120923 RepID=A0A0D6PC33_9PROT|nr:HAD-IA family hydrolase [Acidocella aminolytica]GAN78921.1 phosphoglycolate phosphatase [Acidocella aminolytica 101 = DSM 11237]GBQ42225.1 putative phosphatase [Acidocella aminolytica 101 = DSM 11237]SHE99309.1 phosphoglycolate phosphatase [Acidocella aminolytica 101 = DSM 11237]